jgi:uncharacterized protein (DUF885 family)
MMQVSMRRIARWSILPLAFATIACVAEAPSDSPDVLNEFLASDWKFWTAEYPEFATAIGIPDHDARWTDLSPAAVDRRNAHLRESLTRLRAISRDSLDAPGQLNYDLYLEMLETAVAGLAFGNDAFPVRSVIPTTLLMPMNQLEGIQQGIPRTIAMMPATSAAQYETIVARLRAIPDLVDQTLALMERGLAQGVTPPRITLRDLPAQVQGQIVSDPLQSPLLEAFTRYPASIGDADRERLRGAAVDAYQSRVRPAFVRLHEFLERRYLPATRETITAALLPKGEELYSYNVRWHTTTDLTPKQIHEIGQQEVARIRAAMDRIIADVKFRGSFDDFKRFLRTDRRFYYTDPDALVAGYRDIAKRADPELARLFGVLPRTPYGVKVIPAAIAPSQTTAYYDPGALDAGRAGNMFANTYKLEARPKWEMEALTLHEAVPGHHLQIAIAQELEGLPEFRKHTSYTAFVEGWALYSESLGEEMGFYADPYAKFGQLTYDMWRAVRLVVDTGLHSMGWTRQQAIDFFLDNAAKTEQDVIVEVDRYIVWPGQALGYKIGQLRIRELRAEMERTLGAKFDIRAFHDTVLGQGAVPLAVLEQRVRAMR